MSKTEKERNNMCIIEVDTGRNTRRKDRMGVGGCC